MNTNTLVLSALKLLDSTLLFTDWENGGGEEIGEQLRNAVAALEAEAVQVEPDPYPAQLREALEGAASWIDMAKAPDWLVIAIRGALSMPNPNAPKADEQNKKREHITDGSPCWCGPIRIDPVTGLSKTVQVEPVAWRWRMNGDWYYGPTPLFEDGFTTQESLYATPQQAAPGFTGISVECDFSTDTWSFRMDPGYAVSAGQYLITKIPKAKS